MASVPISPTSQGKVVVGNRLADNRLGGEHVLPADFGE
jgi:hypothetical protein